MKILLVNCSPVKDGATAEIIKTAASYLKTPENDVHSICIDDYDINYCKGCRSCHTTAECVQRDDVTAVLGEFDRAEIIICVSPSYWADIPGQFKAFIDRCTPWCNTHEPYAKLKGGMKRGYTIALRTGSSMRECNKIIESIEHFYGHLEITPSGSLGLCSVEYKKAVAARTDEIKAFCDKILSGKAEEQPLFKAKLFSELTAAEIYEILKARSKVFQFEQNIKYLDEDDVDYKSLHCFFEENGQVTAYLRAFPDGENTKMGRVLTITH